jgi:hypothetical protein
MRAAISRIEAVLAKMKVIGISGALAPPRASRRSTRWLWARTSVLSDMADSVFIGDTLNNLNYVDDAFRGAKRLACRLGSSRARFPAVSMILLGIEALRSLLNQQCLQHLDV